MKLIYLYDEFMRVPDNINGQPVYIFDQKLQKNYQISDKIIEYRYFLAEQAGATKYLQPAKRFFQYWNKIKKPLKY